MRQHGLDGAAGGAVGGRVVALDCVNGPKPGAGPCGMKFCATAAVAKAAPKSTSSAMVVARVRMDSVPLGNTSQGGIIGKSS